MTVFYKGKHRGFDSPMPFATRRKHSSPRAGDCKAAIKRAQHGCMDGNLQVVFLWVAGRLTAVPYLGHWTRLGMNGITHTDISGTRRKLTLRERRLTYQQWCNRHGRDLEALNSLMKRVGGQWNRVLTWDQAVEYADEVNTIITPELKSRAFAKIAVAAKVVDVCRKYDYPCWTMALLKMKLCRQKCAAIRFNGGQFAIIFGKFRRMARGANKTAKWTTKPNEIWGPKSARQWLRA